MLYHAMLCDAVPDMRQMPKWGRSCSTVHLEAVWMDAPNCNPWTLIYPSVWARLDNVPCEDFVMSWTDQFFAWQPCNTEQMCVKGLGHFWEVGRNQLNAVHKLTEEWSPNRPPRNRPQNPHGIGQIICYIDQWNPWRIRCYCLSSSWFQLPAVLWIQSLTITIIPLKCTKTPIKGKCFSNPLEQPLAEYASGQEFDGEEFKSAFAHTHLCSVFVFAHTLLFCLVFLTHLR